jgi:hypothetical protein
VSDDGGRTEEPEIGMGEAADQQPMSPAQLVRRALEVFEIDARVPPPLTLRGGCDLDDYLSPSGFDQVLDEPTDEYLQRHAFWGLGYLDASSWRHYLPRLMEYAVGQPDDPAMVIEALVRSLRPPDRYPPRLGSLNGDQEDVVRRFLECLAFDETYATARDEARQALEEWWWPHPRSRPTAAELRADRAKPVAYRCVAGRGYRVTVPETLQGTGERDIPSEARWVQTWGGYLCADVYTLVTVNRLVGASRSPADLIDSYARHFGMIATPAEVEVSGALNALRVEGQTAMESPAEPQRIVIVAAKATDVFVLTIRAHDRFDVRAVLTRIEASFEIEEPSS